MTTSSMHDARDAEDTRLLEAGEIGLLVEGYLGVIYDRCRLKLRGSEHTEDVAHDVILRLLGELKRGRRYRVPFRVVVHKVIDWKVKEHFQATRYEEELEDWFLVASTESASPIEADSGFDAMLDGLTDLEAQVVQLSYGDDDLDFQAIAAVLGKEPNAVHQIHYRALAKLRGSMA